MHRDGRAQLLLHAQQAGRFAIVGGRPHLRLIADPNERASDSQEAPLALNGALNEILNVQLATNHRERLPRTLVGHAGGATDDAQMFRIDLPKHGDGLFSQAIGEMFTFGIAAQILERQHGDHDGRRGAVRCQDDLHIRDEAITPARNRLDKHRRLR